MRVTGVEGDDWMSWPPKPLGEILEQSGRQRAGDQDLPVLSITMKHGLVDQADKFKKRVASSDTSNYRVAYKNELVVGFPIDEGVLGFQTKYPAGIVSPAYDIWKLRNESDSHIPYLERYLRSAQARQSYASRMQGAVARRRSLTKTDFLNLEIPFPPLDDQIRIAHLLGKVEGLISQRKQHLQQLDDLPKSVFMTMFGDPVRNEKGWEVGLIIDFCDVKGGKRIPKGESLCTENTGFPYIKAGNIKNGEVTLKDLEFVTPDVRKLISRYTVDAGDVCITVVGANIGDVGIVPTALDKASLTENANKILVKDKLKLNNNYLAHYLMSGYVQKQIASSIRAAGVPKLAIFRLEEMLILVPPLAEQIKFEAIKRQIYSLQASYQQSLTDLEALYGVLSQQAFKGELDLSRVALPVVIIEEQNPVAAVVHAPITTSVIELPETDLLLPALEDRTQLPPLLRYWLEAYCRQLGSAVFSVQDFTAALQNRVAELHPDYNFELGASDYGQVKTWVFEALSSGRLVQAINVSHYDEKTNAPILGNMIELKANQP
jgi:type I restriction enzyme S subunit